MKAVFELMDRDQSGCIEFGDFNAYYCTMNGVPEMMDLPPQHFYVRNKVNSKMQEGEIKSPERYFKK